MCIRDSSNPAPVGSEVSVNNMTFTLLEAVRPADEIVAEGNMFNPTPEEGSEYVLVRLSIRCDRGPDATCRPAVFEFSIVDSGGLVHDPSIMTSGVPGLLEFDEMFGGATKTGGLIFEVPEDDAGLVLIYEPLLSTTKTYLVIP